MAMGLQNWQALVDATSGHCNLLQAFKPGQELHA